MSAKTLKRLERAVMTQYWEKCREYGGEERYLRICETGIDGYFTKAAKQLVRACAAHAQRKGAKRKGR